MNSALYSRVPAPHHAFNVQVSFERTSAGIMAFACINILAYISNISLMQWVGMNLFGEHLASRVC